MIITFARANATGSVSFTDDAKRLNVAITRAKAGVVIIGHLATSIAACTSGFTSLLHDLRKQGAIYDYANDGADPPLRPLTKDGFKKIRETIPSRHNRCTASPETGGKGQSPSVRQPRRHKGTGR